MPVPMEADCLRRFLAATGAAKVVPLGRIWRDLHHFNQAISVPAVQTKRNLFYEANLVRARYLGLHSVIIIIAAWR